MGLPAAKNERACDPPFVVKVLLKTFRCLLFLGLARSPDALPAGGHDLFYRSCPEIRIHLAAEHVAALRTNPRQDVPATVHGFGETIRRTGLHLKGRGTFRSIDDKPNFTLEFSRFVAGQRFQDVEKIHLNNSLEDPTYIKEQLGSEFFNRAGIPAPRVSHALVTLNGRELGLYVMKEGLSAGYFGQHFDGPVGRLFETETGEDIGQPVSPRLDREHDASNAPLLSLAAAASESDVPLRWNSISRILDVDSFLTFMALEIMLCHWDGYTLGRNNFRVYHHPQRDKLVFLPWGMDQILSKADFPWRPDPSGLIAQSILEIPEGKERYQARFQEVFNRFFIPANLEDRIQTLSANVLPCLSPKERKLARIELEALVEQIQSRAVYLRAELAAKDSATPIHVNGETVIGGWQPEKHPIGGELEMITDAEGKVRLRINAAQNTSASWRAQVQLTQGRYRFSGEVKVKDVKPLPFGAHQGAVLRIGGQSGRSVALVGTTTWNKLACEFEVKHPEERVALICELRAESGQAEFAVESLKLSRVE